MITEWFKSTQQWLPESKDFTGMQENDRISYVIGKPAPFASSALRTTSVLTRVRQQPALPLVLPSHLLSDFLQLLPKSPTKDPKASLRSE